MISQLINKFDNFEVIRDRVASILAVESKNQQALAVNEGLNPEDWKFKTYIEKMNVLESLRTDSGVPSDRVIPVVNVWVSDETISMKGSQHIDMQHCNVLINIDVYGFASAKIDQAADELAAKESHRIARLVRNIIMSDSYVYLGLRGIVGRRYIQSIQSFQPEKSMSNANKCQAMRLGLTVGTLETGPQTTGVPLEQVSVQARDDDGAILVDALYDYT